MAYASRKTLYNDCLVIDGVTRTGKFMLARILGGFAGTEPVQYSFLHETLVYMLKLGRIDEATARVLFETDVSERTYEAMVGRRLNTRRSDGSSVYAMEQSTEILARAENEDEGYLQERFEKENRLPMLVTHELLSSLQSFRAMSADAKIIHIVRDPITLMNSWQRRGWGTRFGIDPKAFTLAIQTDKGPVPWFVASWQKNYHDYSEMDRIAESIFCVFDWAKAEYLKLDEAARKKILVLSFENLIANPEPALRAIESFIQRDRLPGIGKVLECEKIPRDVSPDSEAEIHKQVREQVSTNMHDKLDILASDFQSFWREVSV